MIKINGAKEVNAKIKNLKNKVNLFKIKLLETICINYSEMAKIWFSIAKYDGLNDTDVIYNISNNKASIIAYGTSVLFIEFGTGITYSATVHPLAKSSGFYPSTWSLSEKGKGYWNSPDGWVFEMPNGGKGGDFVGIGENGEALYRTLGNPPNMILYMVSKQILKDLPKISKQVWRNL